jgi:hypothetical protein
VSWTLLPRSRVKGAATTAAGWPRACDIIMTDHAHTCATHTAQLDILPRPSPLALPTATLRCFLATVSLHPDIPARGFTTVRDAGGADWGLAQAVDDGSILGPRILFTGAQLGWRLVLGVG